ncbi:hypothetical protein PR048_030490 [Dryococelus australis]|uniref:Uncharacterized protein n=1 Tax=Dryococelus australis TaxID=614101 RepID=A0ABQ9GCZ2_9NEOP|nr:hypothetical protein PR048_030490 [Dryococelus australis]
MKFDKEKLPFPKKICRIHATSHLQRFLLEFLRYGIDLKFVDGKSNLIAVPLHRLNILIMEPSTEDQVVIHKIYFGPEDTLEVTDSRFKEIQEETSNGPTLGLVLKAFEQGWPKSSMDKIGFQPYFNLRNYILSSKGIIFFDGRVVIPPKLQPGILKTLHAGHTEIEKN